MKVTIRDVAHEAGVSVATVSRALRNLPSVAPATREKVHSVAERLEYVPDPYASRLGSAVAHTALVVVPFVGQWYYAQVVTGIEAVLSDAGYDMTLTVVGDAGQRQHFVNDVLPSLRRVDGTIFVDVPFSRREIESIIGLGSRVVAVGEHLKGIPGVSIDNEQAGFDATTLLLARGHRRIALVGGLKDPDGDDTIPGRRTAGYRRAHEVAGIEVDESLLVSGNFSVVGGAEAATELLGRSERPDAVFTLSDEMAIGVISAARDLGLSIPEDVCLLGFDDHEFSHGLGLSTVRQPVVEAGEVAAQMLLDVLSGMPASDVILPHEVRFRATTHDG